MSGFCQTLPVLVRDGLTSRDARGVLVRHQLCSSARLEKLLCSEPTWRERSKCDSISSCWKQLPEQHCQL